MHLKTLLGLLLLVLIVGPPKACCPAAATLDNDIPHHGVFAQRPDPISGEWDVSFYRRGSPTNATFKLKLDADKVSGTVESAHMGTGTIRDGSWKDNKLSFTVEFANHISVAITGGLKGEMLVGEFESEESTDKWEAKKK